MRTHILPDTFQDKDPIEEGVEIINDPFLKRARIPMQPLKELPVTGTRINIKKIKKVPLLFLIREDMTMQTLRPKKSGMFILKTKDGERKSVMLSTKKLIAWKYGDNSVPVWVAFENEASPYPTDVVHDGEEFYRMLKKVSTDHKAMMSPAAIKAKYMGILMIVGAIIGILWLLTSTNIGQNIFGGILG